MGFLQDVSTRTRMLDEVDPNYSQAVPSQAVLTQEPSQDAYIADTPQTTQASLPQGFSGLPKRKTIVRRDEDGAKMWSAFSKVWIPVKTLDHEGKTYWFDASDKQFYPIVEE